MKSPTEPGACPCVHLEDLFAAAGAIGLLAATVDDPDLDAIADQAMKFGATMAAKARRRRKQR